MLKKWSWLFFLFVLVASLYSVGELPLPTLQTSAGVSPGHSSSLSASALPAVKQTNAPANIQPALAAWMQAQPRANAKVIVQKATAAPAPFGAAAVEDRIVALGGTVNADLAIINAVAATLSAAAIEELAAMTSVKWISLDSPMVATQLLPPIHGLGTLIVGEGEEVPANVYRAATRVDEVVAEMPWLEGQGIGVAVVDSGIKRSHPDLAERVLAIPNFTASFYNEDSFGHGTMIAGIIGGNGRRVATHVGVAPQVGLLGVKVASLLGVAHESDVVAGLQWIHENKERYNIRVVNISLNASGAQSYHTSPLNAAVELLWFDGIVVIVSAGNHGEETIYAPADDPFVITVGATNDKGTPEISDDEIASFSAYGVTVDGVQKPDIVAPGSNLIGTLNSKFGQLAILRSQEVVDNVYFRMSGTSVSAPVVAGAVALLLQQEPTLNPDQVKYRLLTTANQNWPGYVAEKAGAGYLDLYAALHVSTTATANTGTQISQLLTTGPEPLIDADGTWSSINWSSINWSSINWSSINWSSINWSSTYWGDGVMRSAVQANTEATVAAFDKAVAGDETTHAEPLSHKLYLPLVITE